MLDENSHIQLPWIQTMSNGCYMFKMASSLHLVRYVSAEVEYCYYTHTHIQLCNGPLSRTTWVGRGPVVPEETFTHSHPS